MPVGYLCLVLHAHLPFVRHPEFDDFLEEDWLYEAIAERFGGLGYRLAQVNGEIGALCFEGDALFSVISFAMDGERISGIYVVRNPDKLRHLS